MFFCLGVYVRTYQQVERYTSSAEINQLFQWHSMCDLLLLFYCQEFQMKMESLQQRREELDRKEYQLKESLLKFDKFLKVCE